MHIYMYGYFMNYALRDYVVPSIRRHFLTSPLPHCATAPQECCTIHHVVHGATTRGCHAQCYHQGVSCTVPDEAPDGSLFINNTLR